MISSLFGVAAAKVNSISETIQSLNPTETLENALKTAAPVSVPSSFPSTQPFNPLTPQPTRPPQPLKPPQPTLQPTPLPNQPPVGLSNSRSTVALSTKSNFPQEESKNSQSYFSPQHISSNSAASRNEGKDAPALPDLSGLSVEEQRKIREVLERQCDEDASEQQALTRQRQELEKLEKDVKNLEEQSRSMGIADGTVCQICYRIKFEPASTSTPAGHRCHSCQLKFCASCGHKTQLHTQKLVWQCKICKKKADILARSGKWVSPAKEPGNSSNGNNNPASENNNNTNITPQDQLQQQHPKEKDLHPTGDVSPRGSNVNGDVTTLAAGAEIDQGTPSNTSNQRQPSPHLSNNNRNATGYSTTQLQQLNQQNNINSSNVANIFQPSKQPLQQQHAPQQHHHQQVNNQVSSPVSQTGSTTSATSSSPFTQLAKLLPAAIQPAALIQSSSNTPQAATSVNSNTTPQTSGSNSAGIHDVSSSTGLGMSSAPGAPPPLPPPRSSKANHHLKGGPAGTPGSGQPLPRRSLTSSANRSGSGKLRLSNSLAPPRRSPPHPPEMDGCSQSRRSPSGRYPGDSIMSGSGGSRDPDLPDSGYRSESNRTSSSRDSLEKRRREVQSASDHFSVQPHHSSAGKRHSSGSMQKMDSMGSEFSVVNDPGAMYKTSVGSMYYPDLQPQPDDASSHLTYHDNDPFMHVSRELGGSGRGGRRHKTLPHHRALDVSASGGGRSFSSSEEDIRSTSDLTSWDGFESESLISDRGFDPWDDFNLGYSSASSRSWRGGVVEWSPNADGFGSLIGRIVMNKGVGRELGLKVRGGQPLDSILTNCSAGMGAVVPESNVTSSSGGQPDKIDMEALAQQYAGVLAALVVNVRRGSPADVTAGLVTGDEILEWNKISFRNLTHNQVTNVIMQSKQETEVELVICRRPFLQLKQTQLNTSGSSRASRSSAVDAAGALQLVDQVNNPNQNSQNNFSSSLPYPPRPTTRRGAGIIATVPAAPSGGGDNSAMQHSTAGGPQSQFDVMNGGSGNVNNFSNNSSATNISSSSASALSYSLPASVYRNISSSSAVVMGLTHPNAASNTSASSPAAGGAPPLSILQPSSECVSGQLQMQLSYSDNDNQLTVTLNQAVDLISREGGQVRNPYAKIYLLPDRTVDSLRRTKTCFKTLNPFWNQSFSFHVSRNNFSDKELEVTIWDNCFADQSHPGIGSSSGAQHHSQQQSMSASVDDFAFYKGGGMAVKEFLGEVLLNLDQAILNGEVQWFDLHVHDSSSNHSLPIPSPPPGNVGLSNTGITSRQKSAPAFDASSMSPYGSGSKFPLNSLWQNNADDSIGAVHIGTMDKILKNVRNFQLPLSLNIPSGVPSVASHQNPNTSSNLPTLSDPEAVAVTAPATPVASFSGGGYFRGEDVNPPKISSNVKDFNNSASSSFNHSPSAKAKSNQFLSYIINPKTSQQDENEGEVLRRGGGGVGRVRVDGAKYSPGSRSLPNETTGSSSNVTEPVAASVWSQPGSFFNGLLQRVADTTSAWENNSDPRLAAAQALLRPQSSFNKNGGGRDDIFMGRKGATAPSTPMRSDTLSASAAAADDQRMNRVSLDGGAGGSNNGRSATSPASYLTSSDAAIDHRRMGGRGHAVKRGHREELFGRRKYELYDDHRSPRSNRYTSGYHSAGEGYHYVTSSRHSDFGDDRDDLLYATDIEGPSPRYHRNSRSAFDNWETRSSNSRYSSRSPTYYSDVEATGRRMLRHGKEQQHWMGSRAAADVCKGGGGRDRNHSRASSARRGSASSDHFLDQDGSFPRSLPDPRSSHLRGGGSAVANRFYGNNNERRQPLSSSLNIGGGRSQQQSSAAADQVFRFRRYRGGPASRVRQYNRSTFSTQQQHQQNTSAANFWSPQNLKPASHLTRDRLCHSDAEGEFLSDYEFERGRNFAAFSSNYPYRHASPSSTGPSTPTQSFGFSAAMGPTVARGGGEEQSEHSITPRAGMFSPNEYVNDRNIPMRRQSSVQNPPVSPPLRTEQKSLRRQISDGLNYFGGSREPLENEQEQDYFSQSDASHLRNQNYERRQQLSDRERGYGDRETIGEDKHSRESSRFGDESSFDSPISRSNNKTLQHNLYSPGEFTASYAGEPPPRTGKRSRESSSAMNDRSSRDLRSSQQQYMDDQYNEHSPQTRADDTSSRGDYVQQPPPRHNRSSKVNSAKSSAISSPGELEPPEMYDDGSGSMDEHQNQNQRGSKIWDRDYHENDLGDTTSNVSAHGVQHSRGHEDVEDSIGQKTSVAESNNTHADEEEDDIELAFRRGLESEGDLRDDDEDEDDDIDNWLLAQSKKYGVKMEQVDRSEEAEHMLSASMPVGADAGFYSDTGGGGFGGVGGKKRRPSIGHKIGALVGLSKKSNSLTQLQDTRNKRISIPRSAEVGFHTHDDMKQYLLSRMDNESIANEASLFLQNQYAMPAEKQLNSFVEDLGPGQVVGRQVLGSPCLGEIQLSIGLKRNTCLEVEIVRARNLTMRPQAKLFPAAFVKVYLMEGKKCCGKAKTKIARRTTDPYFQQQLSFDAAPSGRTLQVTVWGDYGRMERKCFMGVAQINLDTLNLSNIVIGWYKLFTSSSLVEHSKNSQSQPPPGFAPSHFSDY